MNNEKGRNNFVREYRKYGKGNKRYARRNHKNIEDLIVELSDKTKDWTKEEKEILDEGYYKKSGSPASEARMLTQLCKAVRIYNMSKMNKQNIVQRTKSSKSVQNTEGKQRRKKGVKLRRIV